MKNNHINAIPFITCYTPQKQLLLGDKNPRISPPTRTVYLVCNFAVEKRGTASGATGKRAGGVGSQVLQASIERTPCGRPPSTPLPLALSPPEVPVTPPRPVAPLAARGATEIPLAPAPISVCVVGLPGAGLAEKSAFWSHPEVSSPALNQAAFAAILQENLHSAASRPRL